MTSALEREGEQGADLQKLQFASGTGLQLRRTNPPLPHGVPLRSKAGKSRPARKWQQE